MVAACYDLPVYGVGAGTGPDFRKYVLSLLPLFTEAGLKVAVVKFRATTASKGSAEGDPGLEAVPAAGTSSTFAFAGDEVRLLGQVKQLQQSHDLVMIDGWTGNEGCWQLLPDNQGLGQRRAAGEYRLLLPGGSLSAACEVILRHAGQLQQNRPVWACVLIGGKSSRMGRPKHLLEDRAGTTWLERLVHLIQPHVEGVALSGKGDVPQSLGSLPRLPDIPAVQGPLTGILSAMRWQPEVSWLLLACDMPHISDQAVRWLLASTTLGGWASLPTITGGKTVEPLFARYEPQSRAYFEELCATGERRIGRVAAFAKTRVLPVPAELQGAWSNINTPQELQAVLR